MGRFARFVYAICVVLLVQVAHADLSTGSGFFITAEGHFVTNAHVIEGSDEIILLTNDGKELPAYVVRVDKANDIAIIKVEGKFIPLSIGNSRSVKRGQGVVTIGYPHVDVQGLEPKVTDGIVNSLSGLRDDPRVLQISVPVQSGNSGGPLVNEDGIVIGIVAAKLSATAMLKQTGDLPQNVNYALKSNYLLEALSSVSGLEAKLAPLPQKKPRDTAELASMVEKSIALVLAKTQAPSTSAKPTTTSALPKEPPNHELSLEEILRRISLGSFTTDYSIKILAPDIAENGLVVPVEVTLDTPITAGEKLLLLVDDRYLAVVVVPHGASRFHLLSTRVKMPAGRVSARAVRVTANGDLKSMARYVDVTRGPNSFDEGPGTTQKDALPLVKHLVKMEGNMPYFKMLFNSPSSLEDHVDSVIAEFTEGPIEIRFSQVASRNPYFGFKSDRSTNPGYRIRVRDSRGNSSYLDGKVD